MGDVVEDYVEKTTVEDQYPVLTSSQRKGIVLQDDFFAGDRVNQNGNIDITDLITLKKEIIKE